ncbi:MAG: phosphonate ABC transporter, permease protein PhnE [Chloroflexi bacterium]|nr:phosphonate ABC transporter, permease protein PhnE [Chloroflexota bacterium]
MNTTRRPALPSSLRTTLIALGVIAAYVIAWRGSQVDFPRLFRALATNEKGRELLGDFMTPDIVARDIAPVTLQLPLPVPCGSAPEGEVAASGPRLAPSVACAELREKFTVEGFDLAPNTELQLRWRLPSDQYFPGPFIATDADGHFSAEFEARPIVATKDGVPSKIEVELLVPVGNPKPSPAVYEVLDAIVITIFMALMATTAAVIIAAPLSFLAASNITKHGPMGAAMYYLTRTFFSVFRSYEPIILAMLFAFWVGFGAFAGVIALAIITIASLGKLYSEAVEHIDPGPMEALTATGANRIQVILYGVIPQIVPDFLSFTIYHWDINVRISTIIGYVGGGGIGYYLAQMINTSQNNKAGTAIWAIVIVVWAMDFLSAEIRKRLT